MSEPANPKTPPIEEIWSEAIASVNGGLDSNTLTRHEIKFKF